MMAIKSCIMDNILFKSRGITIAPFSRKHLLPVFDDICEENKTEFSDLYEQDIFEALLSAVDQPDIFVVNYKNKPMALMGLQGIDSQNGMLWSLFTNHFKENKTKFYRVSPDLIDFYHTHYYQLHVNTWVRNKGIIQWLAWLGFNIEQIEDTEENKTFVHFVRCNPNRKNVYALSSRPVMH
jgi:hypothetical protein